MSSYRSLVELYEMSCNRYEGQPALGTRQRSPGVFPIEATADTADGPIWQWLTYSRLRERIDCCRAGLSVLGVGSGDRVAIISDNRIEWAIAAFGILGLDATVVPMYQTQLPAERIHILRDSGAKVVFAAGDAFEHVASSQQELPELTHVISFDRSVQQTASFANLLSHGTAYPVPVRYPSPESVACMIYTSGTTGMPKGVLVSHRQIVSNLDAVESLFPFSSEDRFLAFLPWAHLFGQSMDLHYGLSQGVAIAINDSVPNLLENLASVRPTALFGVPRVYNRVYDSVREQVARRPAFVRSAFEKALEVAARRRRGESVSFYDSMVFSLVDRVIFKKVRARLGGNLRVAFSGSAPLSTAVGELLDAVGVAIYEGYGLTEAGPVITVNRSHERRFGSVGRVLEGVRVEIDRSKGDEAESGEIVVYGSNVMLGYHALPEETQAAMTPDGGMRTGDLGYLDADGFLFITGRIKEQYKLENGKYVMPAPVEQQLEHSRFISKIMVYGAGRAFNVGIVVPDFDALSHWARERALNLDDVTRSEDVRTLLEAELAARSKGLRHYEVPRKLLVVGEDFTTANGLLTPTFKLKRKAVYEQYRAGVEALYEGTTH